MKTIVKILSIGATLAFAACDGDGGPAVGEADAARIAEDAVGGDAGDSERSTEGEVEVWEVEVAMANGATVEVKVDLDLGHVVVVEDKVGPFDYADFTPTDGVLAYSAIKARALEQVAGDIEAWEFKREEEDGATAYEYEFYVRDGDMQLWEVKFDATDGKATHIEAKDAVDE